jgi:hypothetical protein
MLSSFVDTGVYTSYEHVWRAPCRRQVCLIETNVVLLPEQPLPQVDLSLRETDLFRRRQLDPEITDSFTAYPLSFAVDGDNETKFCSLGECFPGEHL